MSSLQFKVTQNLEEAKDLWEKLSPKKTIDDQWDFRYTWVKDLNFPLHFISAYDNNELVGLLPLQTDTNKGISQKLLNANKPFLEFFGGVDTDDNVILSKKGYENCETDLLNQIKDFSILTDLKKQYKVNSQEAQFYLDRFELDLQKIPDFETFLKTNFDGRSRQRLINRINRIQKSYKVEIKDNDRENLELLFQLNIQRHGENSSFHMQYRCDVYKNLLDLFDVDLFTISLDGIPKAISYGIIHNDVYTSINIGYDMEVRDLQKLLVTTQIKRAMEKGCKIFDAGQGDNGWKEHFHLEKIPQYKLTLNND